MSTRPEILSSIRNRYALAGLPAALDLTRSAFAAGQIDPRDLCEILLALRSGSWRLFEDHGRLSRAAALPAAAA